MKQVEKTIASTDKIFEFETRLEQIDAEFNTETEKSSTSRSSTELLEDKESLKSWKQSVMKDWVENLVFKPARISDLEEM